MAPQARRVAGAIPCSGALRAMLVAIRAHLSLTTRPEIPLVDLEVAERFLKGFLPDDLLVFTLATGRSVGDLVDLTRTVDLFYEGQEQPNWRRRSGFAHVAFDADYSEEGFLCAALGKAAPPPTADIVFWMCRKADAWRPTFEVENEAPLLSYCRWKFPNVDFSSVPADAALEARIVGPTAAAVRRVRHAKFGDGTVLAVIAPDKLEIDFGAHGVRKLVATMVEELDSPEK